MSQAPRGKKEWMREHYEKVILLVAFIALLFSSVQLVQHIQASKADAELSRSRLNLQGSPVAIKDTVPFDAVLAEARAIASAQLAVRPRTTVSEMRVACVKCGRPIAYEAVECPFCLAEQPPIINIRDLDTDGDGMPDWWELEMGLDPQNPADAHEDMDGDGFTNLEEFLAGTDPRDPASMPDPIVKLRVAGIRPVPFYLRFVSTSTFGDGTLRFQLNLQTLERTYFAKLGDIVMGYKVEQYNAEGRGGETLTLVRQSDQRPVVLVKGRPITEQELAILFVSLLDRSRQPVRRLNDVFTFRDIEYKVVDIGRDSVIIENVKTGVKVTVPMMSSQERAALSGRSAAPAPGAGTESPW